MIEEGHDKEVKKYEDLNDHEPSFLLSTKVQTFNIFEIKEFPSHLKHVS